MDFTALFYTSNMVKEPFLKKITNHLLSVVGDKPIISVSQKPIDLGKNICVGEIGVSVYNVYKQILAGAMEAKTDYVFCCEDDSCYVKEHFEHIPPHGVFLYNSNQWQLIPDYFRKRGDEHRPNMSSCVAETELMVETLQKRFEKFPENKGFSRFGEPGMYEVVMGLPEVKYELFKTEIPIITVKHMRGLGGLGAPLKKDIYIEQLPFWGDATKMWKEIWS